MASHTGNGGNVAYAVEHDARTISVGLERFARGSAETHKQSHKSGTGKVAFSF